MPREIGRARRFAMTVAEERRMAAENIKALRLQTMAWRYVAMIGMVDPQKARTNAQWLLFHTVPFVDGVAVERFIEEHDAFAEECGIEAGVFAARAV